MKSKISWKTILAMLTFAIGTLSLIAIAFSSLCLTWTGTVFLIADITAVSYSFIYLDERYERLIGKEH